MSSRLNYSNPRGSRVATAQWTSERYNTVSDAILEKEFNAYRRHTGRYTKWYNSRASRSIRTKLKSYLCIANLPHQEISDLLTGKLTNGQAVEMINKCEKLLAQTEKKCQSKQQEEPARRSHPLFF